MNFEYMKNFMDSLTEWIIPGNSVVIYKDGKKVFEYSSGYSDLEKKIKKNEYLTGLYLRSAGNSPGLYSCDQL